MKPHVSEEQLIQWLFDLADPAEAKTIADHVAQCDACTVLKTQVAQKFAQLDMLQGDPVVGDALIQKTQASCGSVPVRRVNLWWMSLAACLVFAGVISVMTINGPQEAARPMRDVAKNSPSTTNSPAPAPKMEATGMFAMDVAAPAPIARDRPDSDPERDPFEKAPFAPASAIELVTLPTRDDVQITIYNEQDLTLVREQRKLTLKRGWNWLQFM
ncbi:MAG: hypothetical protein HQ515_20420, partial [Phycisphaeraceae bacterium]|nr:hypothetical protein [Phycisphaeraceae bacterium]